MKISPLSILLATTFLSTSAMAITLEPTLENSAISYSVGNSSDYNFTIQEADAEGNLTTKYYKIDIDESKLSTSSNISWTALDSKPNDMTNVVEIKLPNNQAKYFKYTYTTPNGYITASTQINDTLSSADVTDVVFELISSLHGGAIENRQDNSSINITSNFIGNYGSIEGGAIANIHGTIGNITGDFIENYTSYHHAYGGAIYNQAQAMVATIGDITGDFIGNYAEGNHADGGAIYNCNNTLYNESGTAIIGNITGNFVGNYASAIDGNADGGAISNYNYYNELIATIGDINGDFIGNYVSATNGAAIGGAISNTNGTIGNITGDFIGNYASVTDGLYGAYGGAIHSEFGTIGNITGDFIGNHIEAKKIAYGGAILTTGSISFEGLEFNLGYISGSFIGNYAKVTEEREMAFGGAIALFMAGDLKFLADNQTNIFSGNYVEDADGNRTNNAIGVMFVPDALPTPNLNFIIKNNGAFIFDDEIEGRILLDLDSLEISSTDTGIYNINLYGDAYNTDKTDETNTIRFNDLVNNVYDFSIDSVQMALGRNAVINIVHNYVAQSNPYLRLDLDAVNREVGQINIEGDVDGTTNVIVNVLQNKETAKEESIVFATAKNDTLGGEDSFTVSRVIGSPYMWEVSYNDTEKQWGLYSTEEQNPDEEDDPVVPTPDTPDTPSQPLGPIEVAPEVIATVAVKTAGLSQTNGMIYNIMRKVGINHLYCPGCGFYDYNWNGKTLHNTWVDTTYNGLTIESPVEIEAKVWGIEAGSDLQHDLNNKLGIFVSYRQGNYEMDGKGEKYYSNIGSEIDIDSYLAGLYYRYDKNNWYAFATVYGGMQNAEIKTDDGAANYDTDGIEFGGSIEAGYNYALTRKLSVTPSLGAFYSQISYDDATDNVGKTVNYNDLKQVELEAGAKFAYTQYTDNGFYSLYVKPSVVQTLIDGDEISITEIGKVDTVEDKTLGRVELGGNIGFNDNWSAYSWANYTFGSDYEATSLGLGVNYSW